MNTEFTGNLRSFPELQSSADISLGTKKQIVEMTSEQNVQNEDLDVSMESLSLHHISSVSLFSSVKHGE